MDSELDYRLLFEASPDVLLVLLPDAPRFTMVAATQARLAATLSTREETIGIGLFEKFPDNPDDAGATGMSNLRASLLRVIATRAPDTMAVQKYDIRGPDGKFQARYWSPRNVPLLSPTGEIQYIVHRVEDVTELVRASEAGEELRGLNRQMEREVIARSRELAAANHGLRDANARLGQLDAAKTAFFSNISHEFRTPLTLLLGPVEDCLADGAAPLAPVHRARLELVRGNALRLLKLVNALLDFARLEAGRLTAHYAPVDLGRFTAELAAMFASATEKAGIRLIIDSPPLSEPVWVDGEMWERIVPNLLSNAFKFTLEGEIVVRMREDAASVILTVADTGTGIPEAELPRLFERFHRVAGAVGRTHEGTGIGLSLVRELVHMHRGEVSVESEVGRGTTFRVVIPKGYAHLPPEAVTHVAADARERRVVADFVREVEDLISTPVGPAPDAPRPESAARPRVLVVDDNPDLRAYMSGLLATHYEVTAVEDGLAAVAAVREIQPEIVVSDVMMPKLDGYGLVRALRGDPMTALVPVILLSARAGHGAAIEGLDSGADDYLVKPFAAQELLARVRTHVKLARMRRDWIRELERVNRELDAFSYSVSHDLRAPLRAINGFAQALFEDHHDQLDAEGRRFLTIVRDAAVDMGTLVDGLLALARVGRAEIRRDRVDLSRLAAEVGARQGATHGGDAPEVVFDVEPGLEAEGDPRLLRAVFENLLGNAWKFTRRQAAPQISVGQREEDGARVFFVRDNGVGFDMARATKLFSPFQRLHGGAEFEGHGIGLATVQRIVERHQGRIWAEGHVGRGATIYFTLPEATASRPVARS